MEERNCAASTAVQYAWAARTHEKTARTSDNDLDGGHHHYSTEYTALTARSWLTPCRVFMKIAKTKNRLANRATMIIPYVR